MWFTHGDHGDPASLWAFDADGYVRAWPIDAPNVDWEDLAAAPCPDHGDCLYVGDLGDNDGARDSVTVWVVRDPGGGRLDPDPVAKYVARYPDGPRDAEALLVSPCTGELYVVARDPAFVYRWTPAEDRVVDLVPVAALAIDEAVTGGAWDVDGERVALRTDTEILVWGTDPADPESHWTDAPTVLTHASELEGEAVAFDPEDGGILSLGAESPVIVRRYPCRGRGEPVDVCEFPQTGCGCGGAGRVSWIALAVGLAAPFARRRPPDGAARSRDVG